MKKTVPETILLFVDADSFPKMLRPIILKAVVKRQVPTLFAADRTLPDVEAIMKRNSAQHLLFFQLVEAGEDSADNFLVEQAQPGALAITRDIVLADRLAQKELTVLDDRGHTYTKENISERLSMRNQMTLLREQGIYAEQTKRLTNRDKREFANALDRELTKLLINRRSN